MSFQNVFAAPVEQKVDIIGPTAKDRSPLPANQVEELKKQLATKELVLASNSLNYTVGNYIVILAPRDPQTGSVIIHILDAANLAKGVVKILNEMNDQEFEIAKPLIDEFNKKVFAEVTEHPNSKETAFIMASGLFDKVKM